MHNSKKKKCVEFQRLLDCIHALGPGRNRNISTQHKLGLAFQILMRINGERNGTLFPLGGKENLPRNGMKFDAASTSPLHLYYYRCVAFVVAMILIRLDQMDAKFATTGCLCIRDSHFVIVGGMNRLGRQESVHVGCNVGGSQIIDYVVGSLDEEQGTHIPRAFHVPSLVFPS